MQRISTATRVANKFGAGKDGFTNGNVVGGIPATDLEAALFDNLQEEAAGLVEGAGIVLNGLTLTQVSQALKRMFGGNITAVNFAASPFALTADHAGLVLIDATGGNVVLNLPAANLVTALPIEYAFEKLDATANTATVNRAGANTIEGAPSFVLSGQYANRTTRSNAVDTWFTLSRSQQTGVSESYAYLRDEKASGTAGGGSSAGWQTRTLNTEVIDAGNIVTLAANQMTLVAGTYRIRARAPGYQCNGQRLRLRNITAGTTLLLGNTAYTNTPSVSLIDALLVGRFTVAASQVLELQHWFGVAAAGNGLGVQASSGDVEVYSEIEIFKEL